MANRLRESYPIDFINRVKAEFPDWDELHRALDAGSDFVGRYLDDSRHFSMKPQEIIQCFEDGKQDEVLEAAKEADRIGKLYTEWLKLRR